MKWILFRLAELFFKLADEWPTRFMAWLRRRTEYEVITGLRADAIEVMIKDAFKETAR